MFIYHVCVLRRCCINDAIYPRVNNSYVGTVCAHNFVTVITLIFIICVAISRNLLVFRMSKSWVTPYLVLICVYCILHEHQSPNYQWPPFLLCFVWLKKQPAKRIMIAEVMPSTCAQLSIQSDLWFAYQIWFLDNLCVATMLFTTTQCGTDMANSFTVWLVRSFLFMPVTYISKQSVINGDFLYCWIHELHYFTQFMLVYFVNFENSSAGTCKVQSHSSRHRILWLTLRICSAILKLSGCHVHFLFNCISFLRWSKR